MSRDLTEAMGNAISADQVAPILLFEGEFEGGPVRVWTGYGMLQWDGKSWAGVGTFIGLSSIDETDQVVANGAQVTLSGVPADLVQIAIDEAVQGLPGRVWLGMLQEGSVIADPVQAFAGRLDIPEVSDDEDTCAITISYEGRLVDLLKPREWRYTHESQQVLFPGDRGFEYVTSIQDQEIKWGRG